MNKLLIVDVREPDEFQSSHVAGAINIPLSMVNDSSKLSGISKDTNIIVYCNSGNRSGQAMVQLRDSGFSNVVNGINQYYVESM